MAKKRNYEVTIKGWSTVLVIDAKSKKDALELAQNDVRMGDFQMDEASVTAEIKTPEELESSRRHADCVSEP